MMAKLVPGTVVIIKSLSKSSWHLYRSYQKFNPLIICPCNVRRNVPLIVEDIFDNIVLLKGKITPIVTMTYDYDLETVYEK